MGACARPDCNNERLAARKYQVEAHVWVSRRRSKRGDVARPLLEEKKPGVIFVTIWLDLVPRVDVFPLFIIHYILLSRYVV